MYNDLRSYWTDFWNLYDLSRIVLLYVYIVMQGILISKINDGVIPDDSFYWSAYIFAFLNVLSWFRLISYLRVFSPTRGLIRLIIEIVKDMWAFSIVLVLALFAFSILLDILSEQQFVVGADHNPFGE